MPLRSRSTFTNLGIRENTATMKTKSSVLGGPIRSALGEIGNNVNPLRGTNLPVGKQMLENQQQLDKKKSALAKEIGNLSKQSSLVSNKPVPPCIKSSEPVQQPQKTQQQIQPQIQTQIVEQQSEKPECISFSSDLLVEDIDADDEGNPILMSIYSNDIYAHLRKLEKETPIEKGFLNGQHVTPNMRSVLVDWLVEVHQQFRLTQETLYLTVAISDRFFQAYRSINRKRVQLVGITAMFLASKYEEMYSPDLNDFVYITDNTYTKTDVLQMEMLILKTLNFALGRPLPLQFLRRYSKAGKAMASHHTMAKYFLELSLIQYDVCHYPPSLIAAAALYLSLLLIGTEESEDNEKKTIWTPTLVHYSTYKDTELLPVVRNIASFVMTSDQSRQQAVRKKYTQAKHMKISLRSELKSPVLINLAKNDKEA